MLPDVPDAAAYWARFREDAAFLPAVENIAARHGLGGALVRAGGGGNIVFFAGERHVIKMCAPLFAGEIAAEVAFLEAVQGRIGVATPELVATGEIEGWPYVVLGRISGEPIGRAWDGLDARARLRAAEDLGALAARLHGLPRGTIADVWDTTFPELRARTVARHRGCGVPESCLEGVAAAVEELALAPPGARALVHGDLTHEHVFVAPDGHVVALIDFADAQVADPRYEWSAIVCHALRSDRSATAAAMDAYGLDRGDARALARELTAWCFAHRFADLRQLAATRDRLPATFDEAAARLYPIA